MGPVVVVALLLVCGRAAYFVDAVEIASQLAFDEHLFALMAQMLGKHLRTIGLASAKDVIGLKVIAYNMMHLARLKHRSCVRVMREGR